MKIRRLFFEGLLDDLDMEDYRPSDSELKELFDTFNEQYFNGEVPKRLRIQNKSLSDPFLGAFYADRVLVQKRVDSKNPEIEDSDYNKIGIIVNSRYTFTKRQICETILHEMIHALQFVRRPASLLIEGAHEEFFIAKMRSINAKSRDFKVRVTSDEKLYDRSTSDIYSMLTKDIILTLLYRKGQPFGVATMPKAFMPFITNIILSSGKYSHIEFYETSNSSLKKNVDFILGADKEQAEYKAVKVLQSPDSVKTSEFTCSYWYDIDRFYDFKEDTKFIIGYNSSGSRYFSTILNEAKINKYGAKRRIFESEENIQSEIEDLIHDDKIAIKNVRELDDDTIQTTLFIF